MGEVRQKSKLCYACLVVLKSNLCCSILLPCDSTRSSVFYRFCTEKDSKRLGKRTSPTVKVLIRTSFLRIRRYHSLSALNRRHVPTLKPINPLIETSRKSRSIDNVIRVLGEVEPGLLRYHSVSNLAVSAIYASNIKFRRWSSRCKLPKTKERGCSSLSNSHFTSLLETFYRLLRSRTVLFTCSPVHRCACSMRNGVRKCCQKGAKLWTLRGNSNFFVLRLLGTESRTKEIILFWSDRFLVRKVCKSQTSNHQQ